jgi:DNA-binding NarL/FixJ family response regulator
MRTGRPRKYAPDGVRPVNVTVQMSAELVDAIDAIVRKEGISRSRFVVQACREKIEGYEPGTLKKNVGVVGRAPALSNEQIAKVEVWLRDGFSVRVIAELLDVSVATIYKIRDGKYPKAA